MFYNYSSQKPDSFTNVEIYANELHCLAFWNYGCKKMFVKFPPWVSLELVSRASTSPLKWWSVPTTPNATWPGNLHRRSSKRCGSCSRVRGESRTRDVLEVCAVVTKPLTVGAAAAKHCSNFSTRRNLSSVSTTKLYDPSIKRLCRFINTNVNIRKRKMV